jgi:hypothetical protein
MGDGKEGADLNKLGYIEVRIDRDCLCSLPLTLWGAISVIDALVAGGARDTVTGRHLLAALGRVEEAAS